MREVPLGVVARPFATDEMKLQVGTNARPPGRFGTWVWHLFAPGWDFIAVCYDEAPGRPGYGATFVAPSPFVEMQPRSPERVRRLDLKNRWRIPRWLIKSLLSP